VAWAFAAGASSSRMLCGRGRGGVAGFGRGVRSGGRSMSTFRSVTGSRCLGGSTKSCMSSPSGMGFPWGRRSSPCRAWRMRCMISLRFMGGSCWRSSRIRCWLATRARRRSSGIGMRRRSWRGSIGWNARGNYCGGTTFTKVSVSSLRFFGGSGFPCSSSSGLGPRRSLTTRWRIASGRLTGGLGRRSFPPAARRG